MNISVITRRDIIDYLLLRDIPFHGRLDIVSFLKRVWDLSAIHSTDSRFSNAEGDIWQHMINNNDWEYDYLLITYLELLNCNDDVFLFFLQQTVHPLVLSDQSVLSETINEYNAKLAPDGYQFEISSHISGKPIYKAKRVIARDLSLNQVVYEVVLSFAGEDRLYVERVAEFLQKHGVKLFYDRYEEVTLWGKDLAEHLDKVYRGSARYCVMFISENYAKKV
jgi:AbiJ-like protein/TIR domain-containing protein